MKNFPESKNINSFVKNRQEIETIIKKHWGNLLGCDIADFERGIVYILDSKNPRLEKTKKSAKEIQVFNYSNLGTVINVANELFPSLSELIEQHGLDDIRMGQLLQDRYEGELNVYHSVRSYLFDDLKLLPQDPNIRRIHKNEQQLFDAFMDKCSEEVKYEVYMDFDETFHNFYGYFVGDDMVTLGEYSQINDGDTIVMPSIITLEDWQKRGYGKAVINLMTQRILSRGLVPQYRCDPKNIGSRNTAKSLGYEELVTGYSLSIC